MRNILRAAALVSILVPLQCEAQGFPGFGDVGRQFDENGRPVSFLRVTATFQVQTPQAPAASLDDQKVAIEIAHKTLYGLAAHECEALADSFNMECRLAQLSVNDLNQNFRNATGAATWVVQAGFELRPKSGATRP